VSGIVLVISAMKVVEQTQQIPHLYTYPAIAHLETENTSIV